MKKIRDLPELQRPRERLQNKGPQSLADHELVAILLGSGIKGHDVLSVAKRVVEWLILETAPHPLKNCAPSPAWASPRPLSSLRHWSSPAGASNRRGSGSPFPPDVLPLIRHYADRRQEHFLCVSLNGAREVITTRVVSVGLVDGSTCTPARCSQTPLRT
ncbi:MAG: hypothetical protein MZV70_72940 [Desulfobacterales bacterium]|nr:hypothetical protein [Desulfobacterales bacterium]